jgi:DNA-binding NtrC family response regulator
LLLVHPENDVGLAVARAASQLSFAVRLERSAAEALRVAATEPEFAVILLAWYGERAGCLEADVLEKIASLNRASSMSQIILLTSGRIGLESCCQAIECGVSDFLEVPAAQVDSDALARRLNQARQRYQRLKAASHSVHDDLSSDRTGIVAQSALMSGVLSQAYRAAQVSDAPVLIQGESGTGKQLIAELIHRLDPKRRDKQLLVVNCASITGTLAESALFGHVKGAFTGATETRAGYFRTAHGGTVLLDEIGELESCLQPKLLRVLQDGVIMPVGSDAEQTVDVRVLAATNQSLQELIERGRFRLDLYQRINVISIRVPPLRERPEDIAVLLPFFVRKYAGYYGREITSIDPRVYEFLSSCALDGNVRELENAVRRILALKTGGDEIRLADIPESLRRRRRGNGGHRVPRELFEHACHLIEQGMLTLPDFLAECERQVLAGAIESSTANSTDLAQKLGLSRRTFYNKRRKYGL